jgi:RHS repeat-associated protein
MPIDVATGNLHLHYVDGLVQGRVELAWDRVYTGHLIALPGGMLGAGWTCRYAATLTRQRDGFELFTPAGALEFLTDRENIVESGRVVRRLDAFLEVFKKGTDYIVQSWSADHDKVWRYRFRDGAIGEKMPLVGIEDATGGALHLSYNEGRLTSVRQDLEGRGVRLAYLPNGLLSAAYLEDLTRGRHFMARYEYDADNRLCTVLDAAGSADRFEYDAKGRLTRELAKDGGVISYRYDPAGRCVLKRASDGYDEKRLRFNDSARFTEVSDSYGHRRTYQYLPTGQLVVEIDSLGGERRTAYDEHNRITAVTTASGAETTYAYDDFGNRISVTDATGGTTTSTYNNEHLLTSVTNAAGHTWRREYDVENQIVGFTDPLGHAWSIRYDERGQPRSVTNPLGAEKRFEFEDANPTAVTDWVGNVTRFKFDALGRVIEREIAGSRTAYVYDATGNVIEVIAGGQTTIHASYDSAGNLTSVTDGHGHSTKFRYGPCRRLLERIDRTGKSLRLTWGTEPGWLQEITNESGERYTFFRDAAGRVVRERAFDGAEREFGYDAAGYVVVYTNANGQTTTIVRDQMHRPVHVSLPSGDSKYSFDANGNLVSAINNDAAMTFNRDALGRIVRETLGEHWVESRYNQLGQLLRTTTSLGHDARYGVDGNGAVITLTTNGDTVTEYVRNARGQETARQMAGARLEQRYDDMGRLVEQHVAPGRTLGSNSAGYAVLPGDHVIDRHYAYDNNSSITSVVDRRWGRIDYHYDPAERLLEALRERGPSERFSYDVAGNVSACLNGSTQPDEQFEYGPGNRLVRKGDTIYKYDAEGRRITMVENAESPEPKTWTYEWDAQDRLTSLTRPDGQRWSYKYDALGRRVAKNGLDSSRGYLWDKDVVIHEYSGQKSLSTWMFDPRSFEPVATIQNGQLYSIVCDHLGSPREFVNTRGTVALSVARRAWGKHIANQGSEWQSVVCPIGFQGQWHDDESGLFYNRFRYFDPETASFVSQDPIRLNGGMNVYSYAVNPCNFIDPTGLCAAGDLPQLKGKNEDEVRAILADNGFVQSHVGGNAARNETWTHTDGSEVRIHPYGNQNQAPYRSANNAHVHKENPAGQQLTDRGIPSTNPADTHIGIPNPPDLPAVRGRPHGAGTM